MDYHYFYRNAVHLGIMYEKNVFFLEVKVYIFSQKDIKISSVKNLNNYVWEFSVNRLITLLKII